MENSLVFSTHLSLCLSIEPVPKARQRCSKIVAHEFWDRLYYFRRREAILWDMLPQRELLLQNELTNAPSVASALKALSCGPFPLAIEGAEGSFREAFIALAVRSLGLKCLVIAATERDAREIQQNLSAFGLEAAIFPDLGLAPYAPRPPFSPIFSEQAAILGSLVMKTPPETLIISERNFLSPFVSPENLKKTLITLKKGERIDTSKTAARLAGYGYTRVHRAQMAGEFVLRGEVLDIFIGGAAPFGGAFRILLDFDKIDSIRAFDAAGQNWTDGGKDGGAFNEIFIPPLIEECVDGEKSSTIADYLAPQGRMLTFFFEKERLINGAESLQREHEAAYHSLPPAEAAKAPGPESLILPFDALAALCPSPVYLMSIKKGEGGVFSIQSEAPQDFFGNINFLKENLQKMICEGWRIIAASDSEAQAARIAELLRVFPDEAGGGSGRSGPLDGALSVMCLPLQTGFSLPEIKLLVLSESEIFGRRSKRPKSLKTARSRALDSFVELNAGDYVVHINYGIGLFLGIDRVKALGNERDYIKLRYAEEETIFVPIEQVNLVQRYIGNEGSAPALDKLGSKSWEARREKARKAAEELAARLISLYSKRKSSVGFAFPPDTEWQTLFEAQFPYEETDDQLRCVEEIKADMEKPEPMDRLVCGDVGYGKTEVALRACFKAVLGGKQVAFLAPTTILVEQHYETFKKRFADFPVRVAMLSRFVEGREAKKTLLAMGRGEVDILVGTHRIIQKDIAFKDLGLLVIDEEQRFGVKDKERLKELKHNVDSLALSATPIPRTLHLSLLKIRDMSLLTTPPRNRLPIETHVEEFDSAKAAAAIRAEISRGGQAFFLHNKIETLDDTRLRLSRLVPEAIFETAHGRMDSKDLEDVMRRFIQGGFHVLVSTTIIENGIDIPNVNTIIIDRADMYGISQLYQLRGRVGRSDRPAKAYLFYPKDRSLSELATKRLQALSDFTDLGAGFKIALKDMEIRGAGNLLGREQSGSIYAVGFDMYMRLLDTAIQKLQNENYEAEVETLLELEYTGFIPDSYIAGVQEKMEVYKMIASASSEEELAAVRRSIYERFGPPPASSASLLAIAEIRIICKQLAVRSLREKGGLVRVEFARVANINVERALCLVRESSGKVRFDPRAPNALILETGGIPLSEKSAFVREKLGALV